MKLYTLKGNYNGQTTYLCISGEVESTGYDSYFHRYDFEMETEENIQKNNHTIYVTSNREELEKQSIEKMEDEDKGYVFTEYQNIEIVELKL